MYEELEVGERQRTLRIQARMQRQGEDKKLAHPRFRS
jgi:hypothetical protein